MKIRVLVSQRQLSFPDSDFSNFFSISYDTLKEIDDDFLFNYYQNQTILSEEANNGLNKFESRLMPIDINSTNSKTNSNVGIKIIYDRDYRIGKPVWTDIIIATDSNVLYCSGYEIKDSKDKQEIETSNGIIVVENP